MLRWVKQKQNTVIKIPSGIGYETQSERQVLSSYSLIKLIKISDKSMEFRLNISDTFNDITCEKEKIVVFF